MVNIEDFLEEYRLSFEEVLSCQRECGLRFILGELNTYLKPLYVNQPSVALQQAAYILATIYHETGKKMRPVREIRQNKTDTERRKRIRRLQDRYWYSGFYGRGYIQITWEDNYRKFGIDDDPERAMEPETAFRIAYVGMKTGMFTGLGLNDYIHSNKKDYYGARKIVNGLDKAKHIANIAHRFEKILVSCQD